MRKLKFKIWHIKTKFINFFKNKTKQKDGMEGYSKFVGLAIGYGGQ